MISSPYLVRLNDSEKQRLHRVVAAAKSPQRDVLRANIVLLAADDTPNARIATYLGISEDTARKWRRRFCDKRLAGLRDLPRSGRPRQFSAAEVASVKALACELPTESETPLSRWSCPELAREAVARGIVCSVSASPTITRLDTYPGGAAQVLAFASEHHLEGVVVKRADSLYRSGTLHGLAEVQNPPAGAGVGHRLETGRPRRTRPVLGRPRRRRRADPVRRGRVRPAPAPGRRHAAHSASGPPRPATQKRADTRHARDRHDRRKPRQTNRLAPRPDHHRHSHPAIRARTVIGIGSSVAASDPSAL